MVPVNSVVADVMQLGDVPIRSDGPRTVFVHDIGTVGANFHLEDRVLRVASDAFDGNTGGGEVLRQAEIVHLGIDELAQPSWREFHAEAFSY